MALQSVSNPVKATTVFESAEAPLERRVIQGSAGSAPGDGGSDDLLARGHGPLPKPDPADAPTTVFESVIGADDRRRVTATKGLPWRRICALKMHAPLGRFVGTGWLVGPRTIITAGHCVNSRDMGGWVERIEITPGQNGANLPYDMIESERFSTSQTWLEDYDPNYDYAAIHLDTPLGEELGWFAAGVLPDDDLKGALINVSGYPLDLGRGTQQWHHANKVLDVSTLRLFYDVDTFGGQSGAPAFLYETKDAEDPVVVGIHAYGTGGTPSALALTVNSAPRITPDVLALIETWIEADASDE